VNDHVDMTIVIPDVVAGMFLVCFLIGFLVGLEAHRLWGGR
jgi:hypothetical protein